VFIGVHPWLDSLFPSHQFEQCLRTGGREGRVVDRDREFAAGNVRAQMTLDGAEERRVRLGVVERTAGALITLIPPRGSSTAAGAR
jgi:hypothetical protein